jgi:hypothetical protein
MQVNEEDQDDLKNVLIEVGKVIVKVGVEMGMDYLFGDKDEKDESEDEDPPTEETKEPEEKPEDEQGEEP